MNITPSLLESALGCVRERAELFAGPLDEACAAYEINTPLRLAHFLAQIGHESGALQHVREVWGPTPAQERYEGRIDLGNTQAGDGRKYAGRGLLQTTGRSNYRSLRDRLRTRGIDAPDFETVPELLETPRWAALSAADYWDMRGINRMADRDDHHAVTLAVNGGTNGIDDRRQRLERARAVVNALDTPAKPVHVDPRPDQ
jgi:putative chitinase